MMNDDSKGISRNRRGDDKQSGDDGLPMIGQLGSNSNDAYDKETQVDNESYVRSFMDNDDSHHTGIEHHSDLHNTHAENSAMPQSINDADNNDLYRTSAIISNNDSHAIDMTLYNDSHSTLVEKNNDPHDTDKSNSNDYGIDVRNSSDLQGLDNSRNSDSQSTGTGDNNSSQNLDDKNGNNGKNASIGNSNSSQNLSIKNSNQVEVTSVENDSGSQRHDSRMQNTRVGSNNQEEFASIGNDNDLRNISSENNSNHAEGMSIKNSSQAQSIGIETNNSLRIVSVGNNNSSQNTSIEEGDNSSRNLGNSHNSDAQDTSTGNNNDSHDINIGDNNQEGGISIGNNNDSEGSVGKTNTTQGDNAHQVGDETNTDDTGVRFRHSLSNNGFVDGGDSDDTEDTLDEGSHSHSNNDGGKGYSRFNNVDIYYVIAWVVIVSLIVAGAIFGGSDHGSSSGQGSGVGSSVGDDVDSVDRVVAEDPVVDDSVGSAVSVALGDSTMALAGGDFLDVTGGCHHEVGTWVDVLGVDVNLSCSGAEMSDVVEVARGSGFFGGSTRWVFVSAGSNSVRSGVSLGRLRRETVELVDVIRVRAPGARVVFVGYLPSRAASCMSVSEARSADRLGLFHERANRVLESVASDLGVGFVSLDDLGGYDYCDSGVSFVRLPGSSRGVSWHTTLVGHGVVASRVGRVVGFGG